MQNATKTESIVLNGLEVDGRMARTASFFDKLNPILFTKDTFNS
jgi:hypothetical protein